MVCHGPGPARQRGAIGLMGAMTLGIALLFLLLVVDSGRLYLEKRKLQRVADTAALEVVTRGGACITPNTNAAQFAIQSAARNDFPIDNNRSLSTACGTLVTGADFMRAFSPNPSKADAIQVIATHRVATSIANGLFMLFSPGAFDPTIQLRAVAVAAVPAPPVAVLTIRSTLLTVDSTKSAALNALIGGLLGGKLQLDALGWEGLIKANINLLGYLDALAIRLNVSAGNYDELLKTDASVGDLIQAAIDVLKLGGDAVKVVINNPSDQADCPRHEDPAPGRPADHPERHRQERPGRQPATVQSDSGVCATVEQVQRRGGGVAGRCAGTAEHHGQDQGD